MFEWQLKISVVKYYFVLQSSKQLNLNILIMETNLNKTNDIKIRDQKIMDKYVKNGTFYAIFLML